MKVLITGGTGIIGWNLVQESISRGHDTSYTFYTNNVGRAKASAYKVDLRDKNQVRKIVKEINPTITIHSAALANVDRCEQNPELAHDINVLGTKNVADACETVGSKVVFLSSPFVFPGEKKCYYEDDKRDPINLYGETKVRAENIVNNLTNSIIIRTDEPISISEDWQSDTMITWTLSQLNEKSEINVFDNWYNKPICINNLNSAIFALVEEKYSGVYHVVGPEFISRYEWAKKIASVFGKSPSRIQPTNSDSANLPAERPNANLSNNKVLETIKMDIRSISECMEELNSR